MGRLARQAEGHHLVAVLQQYAPTWLVQMPALLSAEEFDTLQRRVLGSMRERMLREMAEALEVLTTEQSLVLVLEDLHWSDYSTLDLLSFVARWQERARLHQRIGEREEIGYGEQAVEVATELAVHFEEGQDYQRALHYLKLAGEKAVRRCANREAIDLFTKGLALLKLMPESSQRTQHELLLHIAIGVPLIHSRGYAAAEVGQVYDRARELYSQVGKTSQLFSVLWGLWLYYVVRGDHLIAYEISQQLRDLERSENVAFPLAHYASGCSLFWLGDIVQARESLERGLTLYDRRQHGSHNPKKTGKKMRGRSRN